MRRMRSEISSLVAALALPAVAVFAFPWSALSFRPQSPAAPKPAFAAFVTLTPEQEAQAMRRAKAATSVEAGGVVLPRADLLLGELPGDPPRPVARIEDRARPDAAPRRAWTPGAWLPSQAAPRPAPIAADAAASEAALAFPKEELLRLDGDDATRSLK